MVFPNFLTVRFLILFILTLLALVSFFNSLGSLSVLVTCLQAIWPIISEEIVELVSHFAGCKEAQEAFY